MDQQRKAACLQEICQEVYRKKLRRYPSFAENVWNQLRFQPWDYWVAQAGILLAALLFIFRFGARTGEGADTAAACSVFLVFAGNIGVSSVARLFSRHMAELEKTLYFDLKQMVCIRMLEAGCMDLMILVLFTIFIGSGSEAGAAAWLLYMLVPFLWSDVLYLHLLTILRGSFSGFRQFSAGVLCCWLSVFPLFVPDAYQPEYLPVWSILSVAAVMVLFLEVNRIFGKIESGDSICLDEV